MPQELNLKPLFTRAALEQRVKELAELISKDYANEPLVMVGVLKGSFIFLADLVRHISAPLNIEFIGVSSYQGTSSTGHVRITHDLTSDISNKHVLLVEDIVDSGATIDYLIETFKVRNPKSLKICALLSKPDAHKMHNTIDYIGFEITREFVIGYGLDLDGKYRQLPEIMQIIQ